MCGNDDEESATEVNGEEAGKPEPGSGKEAFIEAATRLECQFEQALRLSVYAVAKTGSTATLALAKAMVTVGYDAIVHFVSEGKEESKAEAFSLARIAVADAQQCAEEGFKLRVTLLNDDEPKSEPEEETKKAA